MPRVMTIWLPRWPVQRRLVERPQRRRAPLLVCRREARGVMRVVGWAWADARIRPPRIPCGQTLAETLAALSLACGSRACRMAEIDHDDPASDRSVLEGIARWCRRFSPITAVEDAERPECVHVDITGTAELFGGEAAVVRTTVWTLAARGLHARAAVADTPAAARAAAQHLDLLPGEPATSPRPLTTPTDGRSKPRHPRRQRRRWGIVPAGCHAERLAGLPVEALQIDEQARGLLAELGVDTIGQLRSLSRRDLGSRLGSDVERKIAAFEGRLAEPLVAVAEESLPRAECHLASPAAALEAVASVLERLVGSCTTVLAARGAGVTAMQVRLGGAGAAAGGVVDIGLFRPSTSPRHLAGLAELRMARMRLPREIESIAVEIVSTGPLRCRQRVLFDAGEHAGEEHRRDPGEEEAELGMLLDRLAGRLGRGGVFTPQVVADPQPEHAWVATPPQLTCKGAEPAAAGGGPKLRPIWLAARPLPLEAVSVAPDGPPVWLGIDGVRHRVTEAWGPERIETAWWRGQSVRRDYYVVETESGGRWWVFRHLGQARRPARSGSRAWFLHGRFA